LIPKQNGSPAEIYSRPVDDPFKKMQEYGFNQIEFFKNAFDCAVNHADGSGKVATDVNSLPFDGSIPECFYNFGVLRGNYDKTMKEMSEVDINTVDV
jgi:hypothetical protein